MASPYQDRRTHGSPSSGADPAPIFGSTDVVRGRKLFTKGFRAFNSHGRVSENSGKPKRNVKPRLIPARASMELGQDSARRQIA